MDHCLHAGCLAQVPCASTLCVVNLGASEARVELLAAEFVSLRREAGAGGLGDNEAGADHFMFDDDDNYQFAVREPDPSITVANPVADVQPGLEGAYLKAADATVLGGTVYASSHKGRPDQWCCGLSFYGA